MAFRFKQFSLDDSLCAMKVGTDSVLLGAWTDFGNAHKILDIGTGSGLLSMMAAQKCQASITAIDIEEGCYNQAIINFNSSIWYERLTCLHSSLDNYFKSALELKNEGSFDHIITNPPWFSRSLKSDNKNRNTARHNDDLPPDELIKSVAGLLVTGGVFSLILPYSDKEFLKTLCSVNNLQPVRETVVIPREGKEPNRVMLGFIKNNETVTSYSTITIRDTEGNFTSSYRELTKPFYLNF